MKIFNFTKKTASVRNEICIPIAANNLQEAYELFFAGYIIAIKAFLDSKPINQII